MKFKTTALKSELADDETVALMECVYDPEEMYKLQMSQFADQRISDHNLNDFLN